VDGALRDGLRRYIAEHGDKTLEDDPETGRRKVERHLDVELPDPDMLRITVHGSTGHMGALPQHDAAITKWAFLARELVTKKVAGSLDFELQVEGARDLLTLEGGQGFLPTHGIEEIQDRMREAFGRGVRDYLDLAGLPGNTFALDVSYEKLHNAAYDGDPDSPTLQRARAAAVEAGIMQRDTPILGWDVSCDARLFASEYPGLPVLVCGCGDLRVAHSDHENLNLPDLWKAVQFCTLFLLLETGSADVGNSR
jgi:acetylornithine deacetylase/succinyl-diaminopimelate desuccinylase-like protein